MPHGALQSMHRPQHARPRCYLLDLATRNRQFCRGPLQAWWRRVSSRVCPCALCRRGFNPPSIFFGWFAFSRRRLPSNGLWWGFAISGCRLDGNISKSLSRVSIHTLKSFDCWFSLPGLKAALRHACVCVHNWLFLRNNFLLRSKAVTTFILFYAKLLL